MTNWNFDYESSAPVHGGEAESPAVLLVADCAEGARIGRDAVVACGGRLVGSLSLAEAPARFAGQIAVDAVLFECMESAPHSIYPLLDQVSNFAARRGPRSILATSMDFVDDYGARMADEQFTLLCAPDLTDRIVALHTALNAGDVRLNDSATELESIRLRRIADEVGRIAKALSNLSDSGNHASIAVNDMHIGFRAEPDFFERAEMSPSASEVRQIIRLRRMREQFFMADLFADPAWDMLLDLMAARLENVQVSVSSLCIASAVPPTTALRWIKRMTDDFLLERVADQDDGRRIFVRLSDTAADALSRYWQAMRKLGNSII